MSLFQINVQLKRAALPLLLLLFLTIEAAAVYCQEQPLVKSPQETLQKFGARIIPAGMKLAHEVVAGDFGDSKGNLIVLFHENYDDEYTGWVLKPEGGGYKKFVLPKITMPVSTKITAVFFDNADKDADKELFILCEHISGIGKYPKNITPFWTTYIYDWNDGEFTYLDDVMTNLDAVGHTRTVKGVRKLLRKKGY